MCICSSTGRTPANIRWVHHCGRVGIGFHSPPTQMHTGVGSRCMTTSYFRETCKCWRCMRTIPYGVQRITVICNPCVIYSYPGQGNFRQRWVKRLKTYWVGLHCTQLHTGQGSRRRVGWYLIGTTCKQYIYTACHTILWYFSDKYDSTIISMSYAV